MIQTRVRWNSAKAEAKDGKYLINWNKKTKKCFENEDDFIFNSTSVKKTLKKLRQLDKLNKGMMIEFHLKFLR